ncbi:MAG: ABC transporter ATP-binding protein [Lachnospiraceae bacterium]|nr:ABC transporter ATP-binding protein [Lachnospiraceae bacterium]
MDTRIEIKDLSKNYGKKQALKHVNLEIGQGMFGLLGPNGAGKTTLMKVLTTLVKKSGGTVSLCGIPVERCQEVRSMIGYLPQDFSMYGNMGAYEALDYLAVLSGLNKKERAQKVPKMLEKVNLSEQHKTRVKAMSGGMRRRLGIAQAIIHDPRILVVDEPTAGLDPEERVRFRNLLCEIAKDRIVILSTHIVGDIEATCENIAVLNHGEILFRGTVSGLLEGVRGKVYTMEVSAMELPMIQERFLVTGILTNGSTASIKIISEEQPVKEAKPGQPDVEDAYMYLMNHASAPAGNV